MEVTVPRNVIKVETFDIAQLRIAPAKTPSCNQLRRVWQGAAVERE
jgi:hypothetical protein